MSVCRLSCGQKISALCGKCGGVPFLDHSERVALTFEETTGGAAPPCIPTRRERDFLSPLSSAARGVASVLGFGRSSACTVVSHC